MISRFRRVGGVIRPILGTNEFYESYLKLQARCIKGYTSLDIFEESDPFLIKQGQEENTSHFLLHYLVTASDFSNTTPRIATAFVGESLKRLKTQENYAKSVKILNEWKSSGGQSSLNNIPKLFEMVTLESVTGGKEMTTLYYGPPNRESEAMDNDKKTNCLKNADIIDSYIDVLLKNKVIYPSIQNFPGIEFYALLDEIRKLALIAQCKSGLYTKPMQLSAWWTLITKYLPHFENFHYILFALDANVASMWNKTVAALWTDDTINKAAKDYVQLQMQGNNIKRNERLLDLCKEFEVPELSINGNHTLIVNAVAEKFKGMLNKITFSIRILDDLELPGEGLEKKRTSKRTPKKKIAKVTEESETE